MDGDETKNVIYTSAQPGSTIKISSKGSYDPDGDKLTYEWWIYNEAGTYEGEVIIKNASSENCKINIPADADGKNIHVILTMRDNGIPQLTTYRRMVISCRNGS